MRVSLQLLIACCLIVIVGVALAISTQSSNCGGNSSALSVCDRFSIHLVMRMVEETEELQETATPNELTSNLSSDEISDLFLSLSGTATYSIRHPDSTFRAGDRDVVIICDVEFDNVPQPTIWNLYRRTPSHAVGYADGSSALITPAQYRKLDRSNFITATAWIQSRASLDRNSDGAARSDAMEP